MAKRRRLRQFQRGVAESASAAPASALVRAYLVAGALALAAMLLYLSSWSHGFVGDDSFVTWKNPWVQEGLAALPRIMSHSLYFGAVPKNCDLYRPIAGAYFTIVGVLAGHTAAAYHLANILLYGLNVAALFLLFARIGARSVGVAGVATALFIAHPIHTEVVNNIKSADEMLCMLFLVMSMMAWLAAAESRTIRHRLMAIGFYTLAVGCKETAVPMVVMLPALWWFFRRRGMGESLLAATPFLGVAIAFVLLRMAVLAAEPSVQVVTILNNALVGASGGSERMASALAYLGKYGAMLVWPRPLSFDYTFNAIPLRTFADVGPWFGVLLCVGVAAAIGLGWRSRSVVSFSALWMAASMLLVSNLLFLISTNFGERLLYLPSAMACYLAAWLLTRTARLAADARLGTTVRAPLVAVTTLLLVAAGSTETLARTADWIDESTLFAADVAKYPNSARLNNFVGNISYMAGDRLVASHEDPATAMDDFSRARQYLLRGLAIDGEFLEIHAVLGMAEYRLKDCGSALPHLEQAMAFKVYRPLAMEMMADCYQQMQAPDKALAVFRQLDAEGTSYPDGWFELGNDAAARGDDVKSIEYFNKVVGATPDNVSAFINLSLGLLRLGRFAESLTAAERCLGLQPMQTRCLLAAAEDETRLGHRDKAANYAARARASIK